MSRAFRTNIVRRILAFALVALAFNFACATSAPAQSNKDAERMQKVGRDINRIGIGEKVWVKPLTGPNLKVTSTKQARLYWWLRATQPGIFPSSRSVKPI